MQSLATNLRSKAAQAGEGVSRTFNRLTFLTIGLWTAYPLVWAVSEGAGAVSLDAEVILYGLLDLVAKAVFGFILLLSHDVRRCPPSPWWLASPNACPFVCNRPSTAASTSASLSRRKHHTTDSYDFRCSYERATRVGNPRTTRQLWHVLLFSEGEATCCVDRAYRKHSPHMPSRPRVPRLECPRSDALWVVAAKDRSASMVGPILAGAVAARGPHSSCSMHCYSGRMLRGSSLLKALL